MNNLSCREFDEVVHGLVRMELLDVTRREEAMDHAARCGNCAERMSEAAALADATEAAARNLREQEAPRNVETAVMAAFRNHHRRVTRRRTFEWSAIGSVAAIVLIFLWIVARPSRNPSSPLPGKDVSTQSGEPLEVQGPATQGQDEFADLVNFSDASSNASETYVASDFVPVPFAGGIAFDDPGMVVRVQLTRASLAQLGYPVVETPGEDLVRADVLVGEDGWPHGVKLVQ